MTGWHVGGEAFHFLKLDMIELIVGVPALGKDSMLQWRAISGISVFQIERPFRGFVQICCLVSVVLQNLALPMDWTSGFARGAPSCSVRTPLAGCGARAGMPAVPRHGIGPLGPTRPDFWDV